MLFLYLCNLTYNTATRLLRITAFSSGEKKFKIGGCFLYGNRIYYKTCSREQGVHTSVSDEQKRLKITVDMNL